MRKQHAQEKLENKTVNLCFFYLKFWLLYTSENICNYCLRFINERSYSSAIHRRSIRYWYIVNSNLSIAIDRYSWVAVNHNACTLITYAAIYLSPLTDVSMDTYSTKPFVTLEFTQIDIKRQFLHNAITMNFVQLLLIVS